MKNFTTFESRTGNNLRPLPFHTIDAMWWEVLDANGKATWHKHLTDALMWVEGVHRLDDLSSEARQYWNLVAMS
jgi:hypothetical protein